MLIPIGTKVEIKDTGVQGIVKGYDGKTASIESAGEIYQAHCNDLIAIETDLEQPEDAQVDNMITGTLYYKWRSLNGMHSFDLLICNHTNVPLQIQYTFLKENTVNAEKNALLQPGEEQFLHMFTADELHERPVSVLTISQHVNDPTPLLIDHSVKWRIKKILAGTKTPSWADSGYFIEMIPLQQRSLVKELPAGSGKPNADKKKLPGSHILLEKAHFSNRIDLHAEVLIPNYRELDANEILRRQLQAFRNYLDRAIRLHIHVVYAIHGVGKGVLRSGLENILQEHPEVLSFNNNYHPEFGHGATEIFLRNTD